MPDTGVAPNKILVRSDGVRTGDNLYEQQQGAATGIDAQLSDIEMNDIVKIINNCLRRNGDNKAIADIPMNNFKYTGLSDGIDDGDSVNVGQLNVVDDKAGTNSTDIATKLAKDQNFLDVADANTAMQNLMPDGYVPQPGMQSFLAVNDSTGNMVVSDDIAVFSNIKHDTTDGQYNSANGRFTADRDMTILVQANFFIGGSTSANGAYGRVNLLISGAHHGIIVHSQRGATNYVNVGMSVAVKLSKNDYVELNLLAGAGGYLYDGWYSFFSATVLG